MRYNFNEEPLSNNPKLKRLAREHEKMLDFSNKTSVISWRGLKKTRLLEIPTAYEVKYNIKSIIGIDEKQNPIYANQHTVEIEIPRNLSKPYIIYVRTDIWHPNILSSGESKGRVCGNLETFGVGYSIDELVLRIGEFLQYKNYLAEDIEPYPYDKEVAEWVLKVAEPRGVVDIKKGIVVDDTPLILSLKEQEARVIKIFPSSPPDSDEVIKII